MTQLVLPFPEDDPEAFAEALFSWPPCARCGHPATSHVLYPGQAEEPRCLRKYECPSYLDPRRES